MRAWELRRFDLASLTLVERPAPTPAFGEVSVDIAAVTLNFRDIAIASGVYAPNQRLPLIPASDAVGTISAVGEGVDAWSVGDRVIGCYMQTWYRGPSRSSDGRNTLGSPLDGVLCEKRIFPQGSIVAAPSNLTDNECATLPIAALTAWCALLELANAKPGEAVLVQGSGGVSTFAIQIGAAIGLRVIAVSRSKAKLKVAEKLGASHVIDSTANPEWSHPVLELTNGVGANVILDVGGQGTLRESTKAAAQNGRVIAIGFLGGAAPELELAQVIQKNLRLQGITVGSKQSFEDLLRFMAQTNLKPVIDSVFRFEDAPLAFARLASGEHHGKICVEVDAA